MIVGLVDHDEGRLDPLSLEMMTMANRLAAGLGDALHAVLIGDEARPLADGLSSFGVGVVHLAREVRLDGYAPEAWGRCLLELIERLRPEVVIAAGSDRGQEVMAHVAARLGLPLAANCTDVRPGDPYLVTRLRWGGSLLEEARLHGSVKLITVAPHAVPAEEASASAEAVVEPFTPTLADQDLRVRVADRVEPAAGTVSLAEARVVIGGGRGVGSAEGFGALEELSGLLGGAVGCSRAVTSLGWRPHADQIGQTGVRIAPDVYIACGISGATQHMVGCRGAKHLMAINTDPEAPIVAQADTAIIGDLREVVPALIAQITKVRQG